MFDIGTKLICCDDRFHPACRDIYPALPIKGHRYTVRDVVPGQEFDLKATTAILLKEIVSQPNPHGIEPGFAPWHFADASEVLTVSNEATASVGTFTAILSAKQAIAADPDLAEFRRKWERLAAPVKAAMFRMLEHQRQKYPYRPNVQVEARRDEH